MSLAPQPTGIRLPPTVKALLMAQARAGGLSLHGHALAILTAAATGEPVTQAVTHDQAAERVTHVEPSEPVTHAAPAPAAPKAKRLPKVTPLAAPPAVRTAVARDALHAAETKTGVAPLLDGLPFGNIRAPYQRARDKA